MVWDKRHGSDDQEVRASGAEYVGAAPRRTVGESSPTSERLSDRLSKKIMSSYERLRSASGARLRSSSDRLQSRMGLTNSLALEVRASSQTQVSRGFVRPAQTGSSPSWHLTPAWRGVGVCRAREDEKSSRSVVRSQSAVPCVVRASARDPHTKDTEEEARRRQGTVVAAPLGTGRAAVWLRLATTRHFTCLVKQQTPQNTHCCTH